MKDKGYSIGLLGGEDGVAIRAAECLLKKYPGLKISFAQAGPRVNQEGEEVLSSKYSVLSTDLLLVAFGQGKQEKWIFNNLNRLPIKVAIGVGGTFDYLSNNIMRAPYWLRNLGLEWLFRLIIQPWRIRRQIKLIKLVWKVIRGDNRE